MTFEECAQFAKQHPVCQMATLDGGQPRVRVMLMAEADNDGFWFATLSPKAVSRQIHARPGIEACFFNGAQDPAGWVMMRVTGSAEFVKDGPMVKRVAQERAGLSQVVGEPIDKYLEVFRLRTGEVRFWRVTNLMKEDKAEVLRF